MGENWKFGYGGMEEMDGQWDAKTGHLWVEKEKKCDRSGCCCVCLRHDCSEQNNTIRVPISTYSQCNTAQNTP
jgi:hypothetical protein